ncbi:hypothetical protein BC832DRAFT_617890 [Gaertneriomyces semiglobifer]|nr:hypothetical protein BC832DRAFT_617890 [Gaertneriomyces semiglobifer]
MAHYTKRSWCPPIIALVTTALVFAISGPTASAASGTQSIPAETNIPAVLLPLPVPTTPISSARGGGSTFPPTFLPGYGLLELVENRTALGSAPPQKPELTDDQAASCPTGYYVLESSGSCVVCKHPDQAPSCRTNPTPTTGAKVAEGNGTWNTMNTGAKAAVIGLPTAMLAGFGALFWSCSSGRTRRKYEVDMINDKQTKQKNAAHVLPPGSLPKPSAAASTAKHATASSPVVIDVPRSDFTEWDMSPFTGTSPSTSAITDLQASENHTSPDSNPHFPAPVDKTSATVLPMLVQKVRHRLSTLKATLVPEEFNQTESHLDSSQEAERQAPVAVAAEAGSFWVDFESVAVEAVRKDDVAIAVPAEPEICAADNPAPTVVAPSDTTCQQLEEADESAVPSGTVPKLDDHPAPCEQDPAVEPPMALNQDNNATTLPTMDISAPVPISPAQEPYDKAGLEVRETPRPSGPTDVDANPTASISTHTVHQVSPVPDQQPLSTSTASDGAAGGPRSTTGSKRTASKSKGKAKRTAEPTQPVKQKPFQKTHVRSRSAGMTLHDAPDDVPLIHFVQPMAQQQLQPIQIQQQQSALSSAASSTGSSISTGSASRYLASGGVAPAQFMPTLDGKGQVWGSGLYTAGSLLRGPNCGGVPGRPVGGPNFPMMNGGYPSVMPHPQMQGLNIPIQPQFANHRVASGRVRTRDAAPADGSRNLKRNRSLGDRIHKKRLQEDRILEAEYSKLQKQFVANVPKSSGIH